MKNVSKNLNLDWNKNINFDYIGNDEETFKKLMIIFGAGCVLGIFLAVIFAAFLYGIQQKAVDQDKLSYGKLFIIIIVPCILLGLIAGILLL
jgi:uncharacterized membrane protein YdbT with pleckstrin-like domain